MKKSNIDISADWREAFHIGFAVFTVFMVVGLIGSVI